MLAGTGFNLVETFFNSLVIVDADVIAAGDAEQWWLFGVARAGAGAMHGLAAGFAALAFYGLLKRRPVYLLGYPIAVLLHGNWNAAVYLMAGESILSQAGPDSTALTIAGASILIGLSALSVALLWVISGPLRDPEPASIYQALGMRPGTERALLPPVSWLQGRMKSVKPASA